MSTELEARGIEPVDEMSRSSASGFDASVKCESRSMITWTCGSFNLETNADKLKSESGIGKLHTI